APVVIDEAQHGAQVFQVQQQPPVVIRHLEQHLQDAGLGLVEVKQTRQHDRSEVGDGQAQWVTVLAVDIPEYRGRASWLQILNPRPDRPLLQLIGEDTGLGNSGKVTLDIGYQYRHAQLGKRLRHDLQGDGLAGARRSCDQSMPVGHPRFNGYRV